MIWAVCSLLHHLQISRPLEKISRLCLHRDIDERAGAHSPLKCRDKRPTSRLLTYSRSPSAIIFLYVASHLLHRVDPLACVQSRKSGDHNSVHRSLFPIARADTSRFCSGSEQLLLITVRPDHRLRDSSATSSGSSVSSVGYRQLD